MAVADRMVQEDAASRRPVVRASVLGRFEVRVGDRNLAHADWQRVSAERLVKLLLVTRGHTMSREAAADTLWPGMDPATGAATFRKALHYARRALDGTGMPESDGRSVSIGPHVDLDLDRLLGAFAVIDSSHDAGPGSDAVETILELGARDLLPDDVYEDWLTGPRERLQSRWQRVALAAVEQAGEDGDSTRAMTIVGQILDRDDTDEAAHRLAIGFYARDGRHHAARRQFELCRAALRRELDVEPSPETIAAFEAAEHVARESAGMPGPSRLVARRAEIERIEPLLDHVAAGGSAGLVLRGPVGIGKTRLLREVAEYASAAGWRVAWWQATDVTRVLPFSQTTAALAAVAPGEAASGWAEPGRSAAATLRSTGDPAVHLPFTTPSALLAGLVSAFDSATLSGPVVIAVDDLPLLDDGSLDVLRAILPALSHRPLLRRRHLPRRCGLAVGDDRIRRRDPAHRRPRARDRPVGPQGRGAVDRDEPRGALGAGRRRQGRLRRERREPALLSRDRPVGSRPRGAAPGLGPVERRGGRAGRHRATHDPAARGRSVGKAGAGDGRAARHCGRARDGMHLLGDLGGPRDWGAPDGAPRRGAGFGAPRRAGQRLWVRPPALPAGGHRADGAPRRAATQLAIARALAGSGADVAGPAELAALAARHSDPAPVADHALAATSAGQAGAAPLGVAFGFAAGERLWRLFDREAAFDMLGRSLRVWQRLDTDVAAAFDAVRAWQTMADLHRAAGDEKARVDACREAARVARSPVELADAYVGLAHVPYAHGDFAAAIAILEEGRGRLPPDAHVARARIGSQVAWSLARLRRLAEALPEAERAANVLLDHGDRPGSMRALDILGMALMYVGRRDDAIGRLEASLALALELPDPEWEMRVRHHVGTAHVRGGEAARGRPHLERGVELAVLIGDRYGEAVGHWAIAEMEHRLGNHGAAAVHRRREIELLEELGGNPHNEAMAHAHLAHLARIAGDDDTCRDETAAARRLARRSTDPGYEDRVEANLAVDDWSQADT